jgi:uncharacterized membrane protein
MERFEDLGPRLRRLAGTLPGRARRFIVSLPARLHAALDRSLFPSAVRSDPVDFPLLRISGYAGFALMGVTMVGFSVLEFSRFALTQDFGAFNQVFHQIGQGDLNPADTIDHVAHYWQVHLELYLWLIAPIGAVFRSALTLCILQDLAGMIACVLAWRWMLTILYSGREVPQRQTLALCSLALIVFNPWIYWSYAFDFHSEPIAVAFLIASAYAFFQGRTRTGLILAVFVLFVGDVASTYLAGLGLTVVVASRRNRPIGLALIVAGVFWLEFSHRVGAGVMSAFNITYGYLIYGYFPGFDPGIPKLTVRDLLLGLIAHPFNAVYALRDKLVDIYANLSPVGFIGIFSPWSIGVALVVLSENQLAYAFTYSQPNFQAIVMYLFGSVGFTWFLAILARAGRGFAAAIAVAAVVNTVGWYVVWMPELVPHWIRTSEAAAATALSIESQIAPTDEVVASHGMIGRFASRAYAYSLWSLPIVPRDADNVQFVIAPYEGLNVESVNKSLASLDVLVKDYGAIVRMHENGVWWLTINLAQSASDFAIPSGADDVPAWACTGPAGTAVTEGPWVFWYAAGGKLPGYVVARAYWRERAGDYLASADINARGPAMFEVWDATSDELIARQYVAPGPRRTITQAFRHLDRGREPLYRGWWLFQIDPTEPPVDDNVEIRVFTYGTGAVDVYRVGLRTLRSLHPGARRPDRV